jgi:hypothetical protein
MAKQTMIAVREETGRRLQILRGNKKWDDLMNNLINTYLGTIYSIGSSRGEIIRKRCSVTGLKAFEIKKGDIINIMGTPEEDNEDYNKFAMVISMTPTERHNGITAYIEYDWVKL